MKKLGEVATFINGDRGKNYPSQNDFVKEGIPFINAGHLVDGSVDFSSMNYISEEKYEKLGSGKIWNGDLLFCLRGSLGKKAIVENLDKAAIASSLVIIRCIDIFNRYLYYYLDSPIVEDLIFQSNNGSSQPNLSAKSVASFPIPIPPLSVQSSIVSELDCINDIIEMKREQIKELDALAQSIFYDMFGDPIQNEKGWEVKKLGDVAEITSGGTPSRKYPEYFTGNINWYSAGELNSLFLPDSIEKITQIAIEESSAKIFRKNSLMVGMYDTAAFKLGILTKDSASNQACANVDLHTDNVIWLYFLLDLMKEEALKHRHGARQKNLNVGFIKSFSIPLPPLSLQQSFAEKIEAIEKQKELVKRSIAETETLLASRMQHYFEA